MATIFISHASDDKHKILQLIDYLIQHGFILWIDNPDVFAGAWYEKNRGSLQRIEPGANWRLAIQSALSSVDVVIACWSEAAVTGSRDVLMFEIDYARTLGKCIQITIDKVDPSRIPFVFRHDQIFDLTDIQERSGAFKDIVNAVREKIANIKKDTSQSRLVLIDSRLDGKSSDYIQVGERIVHSTKKHN